MCPWLPKTLSLSKSAVVQLSYLITKYSQKGGGEGINRVFSCSVMLQIHLLTEHIKKMNWLFPR